MSLDPIEIHTGVGPLIFGMHRSAVIDLLGKPSAELIDDDGDVQLTWGELQLECTFFQDLELRLGIIATERESATLRGQRLFGKTKEQVRAFLSDELEAVASEEDGCIHEDGGRQDWIEVNDLDLCFWFYGDSLYSISCFCEWQDDHNPLWPTDATEPG